jgi:hypothetical protein
MNKNIKIPDGWFGLLAGTTLKEGDKFWSDNFWSLTGDNGRVIEPQDFIYIRKCESKTEGIFNIGDEVIVGGQQGIIHSPRIYLLTGYGYVIKCSKSYSISNWDFAGISNRRNILIVFREDLIKLAPKSKTVKLNDSYFAEVFKDKVVVGCQTFDKDAIDKIVEAQSELK